MSTGSVVLVGASSAISRTRPLVSSPAAAGRDTRAHAVLAGSSGTAPGRSWVGEVADLLLPATPAVAGIFQQIAHGAHAEEPACNG